MEYDLGRVSRPAWQMIYYEAMSVVNTWIHCRKKGIATNEWWGVYEKGTERPIAKFGNMPEAKQRATDYILFLESKV